MVSFTSIYGDTDGVIFEELTDSVFRSQEARVSKTRTLDGGTSIDHRGFSQGDREFRIRARLNESQAAGMEALQENETYLHLSCPAGFFKGVIAAMEIDNGLLDLDFWVKEKLNE